MSRKLERFLWPAAWFLLAAWTPPPLRPWRRFVLRAFGAKVSNSAGVYGSVRITRPSNVEIGEHAYIGPRVLIESSARIVFGDYSLVSQGALLCASLDAPPDCKMAARSIEIGRYSWIAANAYVGPGVRVGEGAVLGACGCAFDDLNPWTIYIGNPAQLLRPRLPRGQRSEVCA
jgi:putative colanic acid biosynthesis acetyltransferase WcaF